MSNKSVVTVLVVAVVVGLVALVVAGGAWWFLMRAHALGPLAGEALILPQDSAFVAGIDVKRITSGANYKKYLSSAMADAGTGVREFEAKTGVNPERDIDQVFVAGGKGGQQSAVILMLGRFDQEKLVKAVKAEAKAGVTTKTVEGTTVYVMQEGPNPGELALPKPGLLLLGTPALVETTLSNLAKGNKAITSNVELAASLKAIAGNPAVWFVAGPSLMEALPKTAGPNIPIPRSLTFTGDMDPNVALQLSGVMADEAAAKNLADSINGFKAMAGMMAADKPEVKDAASALTVKAEAKTVTLALQLTPAMLDGLQASAKKARVSANESAAVGDVRTVISGQAAYQSSFSHYGELRCLAQPKICNPDYESSVFIDEELAGLKDKNGYKRSFHAGGRSGEGFDAFAYVAVPVKAGESGQRSFCGDDTGMVCQNDAGGSFNVAAGHCPPGCQPVQ